MAGKIKRWLGKSVAGAASAVLVLVVVGATMRSLDVARNAGTHRRSASDIAFSQFIEEVGAGRVRDVLVDGDRLTGQVEDGRTFSTHVPAHLDLVDRLLQRGVFVRAAGGDADGASALHQILSWVPLLALVLAA